MKLQYNNFTEAWEKINELIIKPSRRFIKDHDVTFVKNATYAYNVTISVYEPILDPEFDFGRKFFYTSIKWNSLLKNYICLEELNEFKNKILYKIKNKKTFSEVYYFKNQHINGKGCLMSLIIQRKYNKELSINLYMRASEVTKRLAFDMLLVQRLSEYIIGPDVKYSATIHINQLFNDHTVLLMYMAHKDVSHLLDEGMKAIYNKLRICNEADIKYKIHKRAFKVLRPDVYSSRYPKTLSKDCLLPK